MGAKTPPPEAIIAWWHPGRPGVRSGPAWFDKRLDRVANYSGQLAVTWNAYTERWQVWEKAPRIQNPFVQGWKLLFVVHDGDGGYAPLDDLVMARLYATNLKKFPSAVHYFDALVRESERDQETRKRDLHNERVDEGWDRVKHKNPSVGYGQSNGSKTVRYN